MVIVLSRSAFFVALTIPMPASAAPPNPSGWMCGWSASSIVPGKDRAALERRRHSRPARGAAPKPHHGGGPERSESGSGMAQDQEGEPRAFSCSWAICVTRKSRDSWVKKLGARRRSGSQTPAAPAFPAGEEAQQGWRPKALHDFDRKNWRKWRRKLDPKARFFPLESVVFQRIAVARLGEAFDLYQQARQRRSSIAWHRARIGYQALPLCGRKFSCRSATRSGSGT